MSIALIVTGGFGNGTLSGTIKGVVLAGYGISDATPDSDFDVVGLIDPTGQDVTGIVLATGQDVTGLIFDTFDTSGTIDDGQTSVRGIIDSTGQDVTGLI